jgi:hypothetical protein
MSNLSSQISSFGYMPSAKWNNEITKDYLNPRTYKVSLSRDTLWTGSPRASSKTNPYILTAVAWRQESEIQEMVASKKNILAPASYLYRWDTSNSFPIVSEFVSTNRFIRQFYGNPILNDEYGVSLQMFRYNMFWGPALILSEDIWFKDNGRLCKGTSNLGGCGVGDHEITIGWGKQGQMENIKWLGSMHLRMLSSSQILNITQNQHAYQINLPTNLNGVSGSWVAPTQLGPEFTAYLAGRSHASAAPKPITYKTTSNTLATETGWGLEDAPTFLSNSNFPLNGFIANRSLVGKYRPLFSQIFVSQTGKLVVNKATNFNTKLEALSTQLAKIGNHVPLNLIFKTQNTFHFYTVFIKVK